MSRPESQDVYVARLAFKKLGFDAFALYAHYFRHATHEDLTYYGSFPLMMYKRFGYKVIDGYLFVLRYIRRDSEQWIDSVGLPINESGERLDVESTRKCLHSFNGGPGGRIIHLHPALSARYPFARPPQPEDALGLEYIYSNELLADLRGGAFGHMRRNLNRFARRYDVEIVPYEKKFRDDADRIYQAWRESEGAKYDSIWDDTLFANLLDHHGSMDQHLFMVIDRTDGARIGVFDAVRISPKLAIGVMRKLDSSYPNLGQYCQVFLARHLNTMGCGFLNDGDDAGGRPGLKELKSCFHPIATYRPMVYEF
jgi:hypothetical protein